MNRIRNLSPALLLGCLVMIGGCASGPDIPVLTPLTTFDVTGTDPFEFKAPADGLVTVYDTNEAKSLFDGSIKKDQLLSIDPVEQTLSVGGKMAKEVRIPRGNRMQVLFQARPSAS